MTFDSRKEMKTSFRIERMKWVNEIERMIECSVAEITWKIRRRERKAGSSLDQRFFVCGLENGLSRGVKLLVMCLLGGYEE